MPLIIISGLPTSGKSTRAAQLHSYLAERIASESNPAPAASTDSTAASTLAPAPDSTAKPRKPPYRLHLISDHTLSIPRSVYDLSLQPAHARSANAPEKDARASAYAAVKRVLTDRDIVILDGPNYIKGWRYQLHCEAKAVRTPSVVVQVGCGIERARGINEARLRRREERQGQDQGQVAKEEQAAAPASASAPAPQGETAATIASQQQGGGDGDSISKQQEGEKKEEEEEHEAEEEPYEPENWENLVFRYEEPNPMTRWDSPLFTLVWDDDEAQARRTFDSIWDAIAGAGRKPIKPNQATVQRSREAGGDYLYILDRETQDVVKRILEQQGENGDGGGSVTIPRGGSGGGGGDGTDNLTVELPGKKVGLPQLQRLRRAFVGLNRGGIGLEGVGDFSVGRMRQAFVVYLNDSFEKDE